MEANAASREQVLLQRLPPSNRPGIFPTTLLSPDERVVFETRPSVWGFIGVALAVNILWSLLMIFTAATQPGAAENGALWFFLVVPWLWVVFGLRSWKSTAYAMTDRRVIRRGGRGGVKLQDARYDLISGVEVTGSSTVRFRITPVAGSQGAAHGTGLFTKYVVWDYVDSAAEIQVFAQEFIRLQSAKVREEQIRSLLRARAMANKVKCAYCGSLVELSTIDLSSPKCDSCGAPLVTK
jgi:hypothetical protein